MTFRNHSAVLALLALLTACATEPAHADVFPQRLPGDPARPGWYPPAARHYVPMAGAAYDFDPGRGPLLAPGVEDSIWLPIPYGTWGAGTAPLPLPPPDVVRRCRPPAAVPGPLPLAGVAAAFGWARRLRRRVGR
jgi:hypothetical protein